jgi:3-hydroxy-9,10-secoandrosta-1,3,5(10)-triene-9,17-dione monooxygenase reductase component
MNPSDRSFAASLAASDFGRLRECLGSFGTGVTVLTTCAPDGDLRGITANSFSSVSLEPPLVLWTISRNAQSFSSFMACERFAVNVLAAEQLELAKRFAASGGDKFQGLKYFCGLGGVPLLPSCTAWLECRTATRYEAGDHVIIIGHVTRFERTDRPGLLFVSGRFYSATSFPLSELL